MKANELRIGNYIATGGFVHKIMAISILQIETAVLEPGSNSIYYRPVFTKCEYLSNGDYYLRLNKSWLLRFGWDQESQSISVNGFESLIVSEDDGKSVRLIDSAGNYLSKSFTYVHELQNLYFALSGEELALKS
ncbi:hypothetical protein N180_02860 [Pedobacter antarcticus 4BY]|uniref:Uncharacterized protein n=2 Tax=Pedobacter antarcticus TaxID=34086 RepID=A0A081PKI3_9SPHI|nr:hypothetical protein [Pedobacter antarcticus]KEQ31206.1 hypothetical protein N180_02860 [Pedobacter antarcticus 4BY]SFE54938.1 hypothetical protein SAMN03003324_00860 [Pedobacter antarcticus]